MKQGMYFLPLSTMLFQRFAAISAVTALTVSFGAPAGAYHEAYGTSTYSPYNTYTNNNYGLPTSVIDTLVTVLREENRAYMQYDAAHRNLSSGVFGNVALQKKRHADQVKSLLRTYGIEAPIVSSRAETLYTEQDACRLASQNEKRVAEMYHDILLPKLRSYADAKRLVEDFHKASMYEFRNQFEDCVKYSYTPTYIQPSYVNYIQPVQVQPRLRSTSTKYIPSTNYYVPRVGYRSTSRVTTRPTVRTATSSYYNGYNNYPSYRASSVRWYPTGNYISGYR